MAVQIESLKHIPHFAGFSPTELDSISRFIFEKTVDRGEIILLEGEPAEVLYFVISGMVKLFKTSVEGKEQTLNIVRPEESFNDAPVLDGGPSPVSAQAMTPVILYGISQDDLELILRDYPKMALSIIRVLTRLVRNYISLVEELSFKNVLGRVARILLEHVGDGTSPGPRLTQQEMAAMAGTAREVVGRSLKTLEEEGAIRFARHRIVITDKEALQETAGVVP